MSMQPSFSCNNGARSVSPPLCENIVFHVTILTVNSHASRAAKSPASSLMAASPLTSIATASLPPLLTDNDDDVVSQLFLGKDDCDVAPLF
ncbi:unnamed protein product [Toxocara canis]|uniref:Uncharacterized protein n=1 Tax=Toxocara canis TaxID=6265 RepID=A0A183UEN3_TOXCA|nr:unnamed protein product [Toxocara canis]